MSVSRLSLAVALIGAITVGHAACVPGRTDITSENTEYSGDYDVIARHTQPDGVLVVRVRLARGARSATIARDVAHQFANLAQHGLVVELLGPDDDPAAAPRERLRWPGDIDYRSTAG